MSATAYGALSARRNWRTHSAFYFAVAALSALCIFAFALDSRLGPQAMEGATGVQMHTATTILFLVAGLICVLQIQLLLARLIQARQPETELLAWIGIRRMAIVTGVMAEYTAHLSIGAILGIAAAGVLMVSVPSLQPTAAAMGIGAGITYVAVLIGVVPATVVLVNRDAR